MSCLSDFKVVAIMGDKTEDLINENLSEKNSSFFRRIRRKISQSIKERFFKFLFGDIL
jgi:hypothetical protein